MRPIPACVRRARLGTFLPAAFAVAVMCTALSLTGTTISRAQEQSGLGSNFNGLQIDGDKPISIESSQLDVDDKQGIATFTGDVQVDQADTQLKTGKLVVYYDRSAEEGSGSGKGEKNASAKASPLGGNGGKISKLEASDKVYVRSADQVATAENANFDMKTQKVVMNGDVVLSQGKNVAEGCRLTIQMDTGKARLESGQSCGGSSGSNGRVRMMLTPGSASNGGN